MSAKASLTRLFSYDPHNPMYRVGLALIMDEEDIIMLPLNQLVVEGEKQEDVSYAYTRSDLLARDFVPVCCTFGMVSEFSGKPVIGCVYAWFKRLAEICSREDF